MPFEITRDIAMERGLDVDEAGFKSAMDEHRINSGAGTAMGELGGEDVEIYQNVVTKLIKNGDLPESGVDYDPYSRLEVSGKVLALIQHENSVSNAKLGDEIELILPETCFYVE